MFIWILLVLLFGFFAAIGFYKGAIRMGVSLLGLFLGVFLAIPLSPMVTKLLPSLGVKNPLWIWALPPAIVFLLISGIFIGLSFFVHQRVSLFYKYKSDDYHRLKWERLNHRLGMCLGFLTGAIYAFLIGIFIYVPGYFAVKAAPDENSPAVIRFWAKTREDLHKSGLDNSIAALDPTPQTWYKMGDVLALIYQNPILHARLANYPPFLHLGDITEFQEIATDKEYSEMLLNKAPISAVMEHPKTQAILVNQALMDSFKTIDLNDLETFLKTGKSPKYDSQKILGRWHLDTDSVAMAVKKSNTDMNAAQLIALRQALSAISGLSLTAMVDNKIVAKMEGAADPAAVPPDPAAPAPDSQEALLANRYNITPQRPPPRPAVAPKPTPTAEIPPVIQVSGEGTWKQTSTGYEISLPDPKGKSLTLLGRVQDDQLILSQGIHVLIFNKSE